MNNIFSKDIFVHERFDLKGSTYQREVFPQGHKPDWDVKVALKDLDFIRNKGYFEVTGAQKDLLLASLDKDCEFF